MDVPREPRDPLRVAGRAGIDALLQRGFEPFAPQRPVITTRRNEIRRTRGAASLAFRCLPAALVLACLLGCAKPPRSGRAVLLGPENRVFLVLPLNVATAMPSELEPFSKIVWDELQRYLQAQGKQLKTVSPQTAHNLWIKSIRQVRARTTGEPGVRAGYDEAARALAVELRKVTEFDAMVAPSLFIRQAPIVNRFASWDGVERELEFSARGLEARGFVGTPLEGAAPAASLHIAVFDAQGDKIHEAKGGLELLAQVRVTGKDESGTPTFEFEPRSDLFENRANVREGIAAAFALFLPALPK